MRTKWIIAVCMACGLVPIGCERHEPVSERDTSTTTTYGNVDRSNPDLNRDGYISDAERQYNSLSDEMHDWTEATKDLFKATGDKIAEEYREARDNLDEATADARQRLGELKDSTADTLAEQRRKFDDAMVKLRRSFEDASQRFKSDEPVPAPTTVPAPSAPEDQPAAPGH